MRISFLSASGQLGGAETSLLDMLASLRAARPSWPLQLVSGADGPLVERASALGVAVAVTPFPAEIARLGETGSLAAGGPAKFAAQVGRAAGPIARYVGAIRDAITPFSPDIVHTNGFKMHLLGAYAAGDAAVVWHMHDYVRSRRVSARLLKWTAGRASAVIANSNSVAEDVRLALGAVPVTTIYNAVDVQRFAPEGAALDLDRLAGVAPPPPGTVRVGLVATFARWKGHDTLLDAIAKLPRTLPVRAYVIGGPVYQTDGSQWSLEELRAAAQARGVADRVVFTGVVDRADAALRALDIAVHASTQPEPFGLVIAEAMACGRAVIVSDAGGAAELVAANDTALTHTPGDRAQLAAAILSLATDADRRMRLGRAARATALARFDRSRLAGELSAVYEQAVHAHAPAARL